MEASMHMLLDTKLRCAGIIPKYVLVTQETLMLQFCTYQDVMSFMQFVETSQRQVVRFSLDESATKYKLVEFVLSEYEFDNSINVCVPIATAREFVESLETPKGPLMPDVVDYPVPGVLTRHIYALTGREGYDFTMAGALRLIKLLLGYANTQCRQKNVKVMRLVFEAFLVGEVADIWKQEAKMRKAMWDKMVELRQIVNFDVDERKLTVVAHRLSGEILRWVCRMNVLPMYVVASEMVATYGSDVASCVAWKLVEASM